MQQIHSKADLATHRQMENAKVREVWRHSLKKLVENLTL